MTISLPHIASIVASLSMISVPALAASNDLNGLDANQDGKISRQEAEGAQRTAFDRLDHNHDHALSESEFAASQPLAPEDAKPHQLQRRRESIHRWFTNMDKNGNGGVSKSEYLDAIAPYFDRLDNDDNGVLDAGELQKAVAAPRQ